MHTFYVCVISSFLDYYYYYFLLYLSRLRLRKIYGYVLACTIIVKGQHILLLWHLWLWYPGALLNIVLFGSLKISGLALRLSPSRRCLYGPAVSWALQPSIDFPTKRVPHVWNQWSLSQLWNSLMVLMCGIQLT